MTLYILRGAFLLLATAVASLYLLSSQEGVRVNFLQSALILITAVLVALAVIGGDVANPRKRLSSVSGLFLGLVAGLLAAYALSFVVDLIGLLTAPEITLNPPDIVVNSSEYFALSESARRQVRESWVAYNQQIDHRSAFLNLLEGVKVFIGLITCYVGITLVLQTKDDFRFVIPYVEFAKEIRGNRPTILDTSVIVDGRVLDIIETRVLQGSVIVPKFVLDELQTIADASDKLKRARGRRGLDVLQKLQGSHLVDVHVDDREVEGVGVDQKLISLAHVSQARVMTNDYNLNKVATLRGVDVVNLNDLAKAMRPVVLPGEHLTVKLVKPGETPSQGVGYLDDGTMIVVEDGRGHLGEEVDLVVTSTLQTSAGRMIFGRFDSSESGDSAAGRSAAGMPAPAPDRSQDSAVGAAPSAPSASAAPSGPARRAPRASRRNPRRS